MRAPSGLDVVEDILRRESDVLARRSDATDTRAGMLLAFSGLLASLGTGGWPPLAVATRLTALLAATTAVRALRATPGFPVRMHTVNVLLDLDPVAARLAALRRARLHYEVAAGTLDAKVARARLASRLVVLALACAITGATVEVFR